MERYDSLLNRRWLAFGDRTEHQRVGLLTAPILDPLLQRS